MPGFHELPATLAIPPDVSMLADSDGIQPMVYLLTLSEERIGTSWYSRNSFSFFHGHPINFILLENFPPNLLH